MERTSQILVIRHKIAKMAAKRACELRMFRNRLARPFGSEENAVEVQEPGGRRATLAVVALAAGVSKATVSKVLNGREDVNPETRIRIAQVLVDHGYVPRLRRPATARRSAELVYDGLRSPCMLEV